MKTMKIQLDVANGKISMEIGGEKIIKEVMPTPSKSNAYLVEECNLVFEVDVEFDDNFDDIIHSTYLENLTTDKLESAHTLGFSDNLLREKTYEIVCSLDSAEEVFGGKHNRHFRKSEKGDMIEPPNRNLRNSLPT